MVFTSRKAQNQRCCSLLGSLTPQIADPADPSCSLESCCFGPLLGHSWWCLACDTWFWVVSCVSSGESKATHLGFAGAQRLRPRPARSTNGTWHLPSLHKHPRQADLLEASNTKRRVDPSGFSTIVDAPEKQNITILQHFLGGKKAPKKLKKSLS